MEKQLRPGRQQDAGTQADTTRPKGIPGKKTRSQGLPRRARGPVQRPQARSAAPDVHGGGALLTDEERDALMAAAHGVAPVVQAKGNPAAQAPPQPRKDAGPKAADAEPHDALEHRPTVEQAGPEHVQVQSGEVLTVQASAADAVEVVIASSDGAIIARDTGTIVRLTHVPRAAGTFAIHTRAPGATGLRAADPSAQVMVAVEPAGSAESTGEDGAAFLNARQHLLLNLFGVTPRALHSRTGLALAEALEALEVVARSAGTDAEAMPASAGGHQLTIRHGTAGRVEHALYTLTSEYASLTLETVFDAGSGVLSCRLVYRDVHGAEIRGALQHTVALADGVPVQPAADPVGGYLASDPGLVDTLDDFSDLAGEDERNAEGLGSFFEDAFAGDFAGNDSWSATAGQTALGLVPVAGQLADIRDIVAAGADVFGGTDGAWARLGISVVAIVPGLDFLKGGSKAGRKALNQAAREATQGTAASGLKRIREVAGKAVAARANRELKVLAVARPGAPGALADPADGQDTVAGRPRGPAPGAQCHAGSPAAHGPDRRAARQARHPGPHQRLGKGMGPPARSRRRAQLARGSGRAIRDRA